MAYKNNVIQLHSNVFNCVLESGRLKLSFDSPAGRKFQKDLYIVRTNTYLDSRQSIESVLVCHQ